MISELAARPLEKPWGRADLSPYFPALGTGGPVGEILFDPGSQSPLLVKYLFTSQALSVQVHPDDAVANRHGRSGGKEEAWLILAAEPDARIALGLRETIDSATLAAAARDGSIESLLDWKPVAAGDTILVPAGTIHAIGTGIVLIEVQQNHDITYRLYDYGRPRELHVDPAIEAATCGPYRVGNDAVTIAPGRSLIVDGTHLAVERWVGPGRGSADAGLESPVTFIPLGEGCRLDDIEARPSTVWQGRGEIAIELDAESAMLIAWPRSAAAPSLDWQAV